MHVDSGPEATASAEDDRPVASQVRRSGEALFRESIWAVGDQGLFALSSFVLVVMLARWLPPGQFGAFTVAFTAFQVLGLIHAAALVEPMLVFGPTKSGRELDEYLASLFAGHIIFSLVVLVLLLLSALVVGAREPTLGTGLVAMTPAVPCVLFLWLVRRLCYVRQCPQVAVAGGVGQLVLVTIGVYVLYRSESLSVWSAWTLWASSALVISGILAGRLRVRVFDVPRQAMLRRTLLDHWKYGRWAMASAVIGFVPGGIYYVALPLWHGLEAAAVLKALMNLAAPVAQTSAALAMLMITVLSGLRGTGAFRSSLSRVVLGFLAAGVLYALLLGYFGRVILHGLYAHDAYTAYARTLWVVGLTPVVFGLGALWGAGLRALQRPDLVFRGAALAAGLAGTVGVLVAMHWGVEGAIVATLIGYGVMSVSHGVLLRSVPSFRLNQ